MHRFQIIDFQGKKLLVKRTIREHSLKPGYDQQLLKEWSMSDVLLKKNGILYCCEVIQEAEVIGWDNQSANVI